MTPLRSTPRRTDLALTLTEPSAEILATYRAGLRLMALRALGNADLAEDVAQETLSRALATIRGGENRIDHLGAFVHGIARYVIADILRGREQATDASVIDQHAAATPDPLTAAISGDERDRVHHALAKLSGSDRALLKLSFFEGLSPAQVAQRIGESAVLVRKRKSRALQRLREIFLGREGHDSLPHATENQRKEDMK